MAYPSILKEGVTEVADADKTDEAGETDEATEEVVEDKVAEPPNK